MSKPLWAVCVVAVTGFLGVGTALSADQEPARQRVQMQSGEFVYGSQLMTVEERAEHRAKMRAASSAEAREQIRREHHEQMKRRAEERGVSLPDEPPARGRGMGRCGGSASPCGARMAAVPPSPSGPGAEAAMPGIAYFSGGIGEDDPVAKMSEHYNLHMVFATKGSGEYLADIKVLIEDGKGKKILEADSPGPVFYARLPSGTYRITAGYQGQLLRKSVVVKDRRLSDLYFHWRSDESTAERGRS